MLPIKYPPRSPYFLAVLITRLTHLTCHTPQPSFTTPPFSPNFFSTTGFTPKLFHTAEENDLYLRLTASFKEKLARKSAKISHLYSATITQAITPRPPSDPTLLHRINVTHDLPTLDRLAITLPPMAVHHNALIRSYLVAGAPDRALALYESMIPRAVLPTQRTFALLIRTYTKSDPARALVLASDMSDLGLTPRSSFEFAVLLRLFVHLCSLEDVHDIWSKFVATLAKDGGKTWNADPWGVYVPFLVEMGETNNAIEAVAVLLDKPEIAIAKPVGKRIVSCCKLVAKEDPALMERLIMRVRGNAPEYVIRAVVEGYVKRGEMEHATRFARWWMQAVEARHGLESELAKDKEWWEGMEMYGLFAPGKG